MESSFLPPIHERETDELIDIIIYGNNHYETEAVEQAIAELVKRGVSEEEQHEIIKQFHDKERQLELEHQQELKENETVSYSYFEMLLIFFVSPIFISRRFFNLYMTFSELRDNNYKKKFKQRIFLLAAGLLFYISAALLQINKTNEEWLKKVDNTDITKWEKNRITDDSTYLLNDSTK